MSSLYLIFYHFLHCYRALLSRCSVRQTCGYHFDLQVYTLDSPGEPFPKHLSRSIQTCDSVHFYSVHNEYTLTRIIKQILLAVYNASLLREIGKKMSCTPKKIIGCIGKCTSGLTKEELDNITDHIRKTLNDCKGKIIFREFLRQSKRADDLACLDFYEKICIYVENDRNESTLTTEANVEILTENVNEALDIAADLYGVPEIDMALLERFSECLTNPCRATMLDVLADTKLRLEDHLTNTHKDFKIYIVKPCPKVK